MTRVLDFSRRPRNFNSHAHVERDMPRIIDDDLFNNFNSHAHVERDIVAFNNKPVRSISTHTLTWSVTRSVAGIFINTVISTHTLTWSVTRYC